MAGGRGGDSWAAVINILVLAVAPWLGLFLPSLPFSFCSHMFHIGGEDYSKDLKPPPFTEMGVAVFIKQLFTNHSLFPTLRKVRKY